MRRFFDDTSSSKMFGDEKLYHHAINHMGKKAITKFAYELRNYSIPENGKNYTLVDTFGTKGGAQLAKSFAEFETGDKFAVVTIIEHYLYGKSITG